MQAPEGYTQDEWDGLTDAEREGILGDDLSEEEKSALEEIAEEEEEIDPNDPAAGKEEVATPEAGETGSPSEETDPDAGGKDNFESHSKAGEPFDFDEAEDRYMDAMVEGDRDLAKQIRAEIRDEEKKLLYRESEEVDAVNKVVSSAYSKYPFLDNTAKDCNTKAIEMVRTMAGSYMGRDGLSRAAAISKAVEEIGPLFDTTTVQKPKKPKEDRPDLKTLGNIPQAQDEDTGKDPFAALDALEGESYEEALEKLSPAQRDAYLKRV